MKPLNAPLPSVSQRLLRCSRPLGQALAKLAGQSLLRLSWQTYPGFYYELLASSAPNMPLDSWANVFNQVALSNSMSFTDTINQSSRFYRVRELQAPPAALRRSP